jgi:hypothetical protein
MIQTTICVSCNHVVHSAPGVCVICGHIFGADVVEAVESPAVVAPVAVAGVAPSLWRGVVFERVAIDTASRDTRRLLKRISA